MAEYLIHLRPELSAVPDVIRLRRLLKAALRVYSFRAVEVKELTVIEAGADRTPASEAGNAGCEDGYGVDGSFLAGTRLRVCDGPNATVDRVRFDAATQRENERAHLC